MTTASLTADALTRGCDATKAFIVRLAACRDEHYAALRDQCLAVVREINGYRGALLDLQLRMQAAEFEESDPVIAGKFYELADKLKTADRLSGEIVTSVGTLMRHLQQTDSTFTEIVKLAQTEPTK